MSDNKCREEFEALVVSGAIIPSLFTDCVMYANRVKMVSDFYGNGIYSNTELQNAYNVFCLAWKASRKSMNAIELPEKVFVNKNVFGSLMSECANQMRESCKDAITSAGYEVEE